MFFRSLLLPDSFEQFVIGWNPVTKASAALLQNHLSSSILVNLFFRQVTPQGNSCGVFLGVDVVRHVLCLSIYQVS